ncbi:hypothetical protein BCR35DRAFT_353100 [Leucosporidium creatinivorum]|uniref:GDP-fucose protein O-fucosyltransferase-domain-containing protein n=1 Tax=Leucosporidium creatinivorum TaxID=106004 RepID=A0A1Y2F112_9BASI|nr:hypothetical protein BCR35DRAFT_353100 [Leucosporidium creatinivorum]
MDYAEVKQDSRRLSAQSFSGQHKPSDSLQILVTSPLSPGFRPSTPIPESASYLRAFPREPPPPEYAAPRSYSDWRSLAQRNLKRVCVVFSVLVLSAIWWTSLLSQKNSRVQNKAMKAFEREVERNLSSVVNSVFAPEPPDAGAACDEEKGIPCKFVLAGVIKEQETKAQAHLHQLGLLAFALNRTLVLPQVSGSRFGTCSKRPFPFYYDSNTFSSFGIRTISHAEFVGWSSAQERLPSSRVVAIAQGGEEKSGGIAPAELAPKKLCLDSLALDIEEPPLALYAPYRFHQWDQERIDSVGAGLVTALLPPTTEDGDFLPTPDVLAVHFSLRFPILNPYIASKLVPSLPSPRPFSHFAPAPMWTEVAERIVSRLAPFAAIHWRIETLPTFHLPACASSLVDQLVMLHARQPKLTSVYLATDYPLSMLAGEDGGSGKPLKANSDTFTKLLSSAHHAAMQGFVAELKQRAPNLRLTSYQPELASLSLPSPLPTLLEALPSDRRSLNDLDSGVPSLIDKLVAQRAAWFFAGLASEGRGTEADELACGKSSSYTEEIVDGRARQLREVGEGGEVWNKVEHFSVRGKWEADEW